MISWRNFVADIVANCNLVQKALILRVLCSQRRDSSNALSIDFLRRKFRCHHAVATKKGTTLCSLDQDSEFLCLSDSVSHLIAARFVESLNVNLQDSVQRQRWLGYHCPLFFADLSSVGRSRYRASMYTSLSSHRATLSRASCLPIRRSKQVENPLLRTLPDQSTDLALNRLVVKTCSTKSLAPAPAVFSSRAQSPSIFGHSRRSSSAI